MLRFVPISFVTGTSPRFKLMKCWLKQDSGYLRCYRTQIELSADYNLDESNVNRTIQKVENALIQLRIFALPKRNQNLSQCDR